MRRSPRPRNRLRRAAIDARLNLAEQIRRRHPTQRARRCMERDLPYRRRPAPQHPQRAIRRVRCESPIARNALPSRRASRQTRPSAACSRLTRHFDNGDAFTMLLQERSKPLPPRLSILNRCGGRNGEPHGHARATIRRELPAELRHRIGSRRHVHANARPAEKYPSTT